MIKLPSFYTAGSSLLMAANFLVAIQLVAVMGGGAMPSAAAELRYNAMFAFGDSMAETGNICAASTNKTELDVLTCTHPPYGMTYFGKPSCRWCNGRIALDFIAQALGLPLLPPSKAEGVDFRRGVNMAITGSTAMDFSFYNSLGIHDPVWNHGSLHTQIQWFQQLMPSICGTDQSCKEFLRNSLFMFGGFGGNDYNIQFLELGLKPEQGMNYTLKIVDAIVDGVEKMIELGAVHIVVPGIFPTGCLPIFLSLYANSSGKADLDDAGCLKPYNKLTEYHNSMLRERLQALQSKHQNSSTSTARIMYADYYTLVYQMVQDPQRFGFSDPLQACCGAGGGRYNFDVAERCGMEGATTACRDPAARLSWDGVHPTEAANKIIAQGWLRGPYCDPPILG